MARAARQRAPAMRDTLQCLSRAEALRERAHYLQGEPQRGMTHGRSSD